MRYIAKQTDNTFYCTEINKIFSIIYGDQLQTTLSELKEMWENEKIWNECNRVYPLLPHYMFNDPKHHDRKVMFYTLKNTPRKFTIEQVDNVAMEVYKGMIKTKTEILEYLTKLPPNGIEVEIEGNKIVKVYV